MDAVNLEANRAQSNEAAEQVAFSDVILINKIDFVGPEQIARIEARIRKLNPLAVIHHTANIEIDSAKVIGIGAFDLVQKLEVDPEFWAITSTSTTRPSRHSCWRSVTRSTSPRSRCE